VGKSFKSKGKKEVWPDGRRKGIKRGYHLQRGEGKKKIYSSAGGENEGALFWKIWSRGHGKKQLHAEGPRKGRVFHTPWGGRLPPRREGSSIAMERVILGGWKGLY